MRSFLVKINALVRYWNWRDDGTSPGVVLPPSPNAALTGGILAVPSNGVVGTESPHPMLCFQHGGSEACEAVNRKHGFTCPKCSNIPICRNDTPENLQTWCPVCAQYHVNVKPQIMAMGPNRRGMCEITEDSQASNARPDAGREKGSP